MAADSSEIKLLTRSRPIAGPALLGALAVGCVVGAVVARSDAYSAHVGIALALTTLGLASAAAAVWGFTRAGAVTSKLTGTRRGLMWGANGTEHIVTLAKLTTVSGSSSSRTVRFVSGKWHADTLECRQGFESVIRFVQANSHVEVKIDGRPAREVMEAPELRDEDEAPSTERSEELQIVPPPESQVRLRESEVEA